MIINGYNYMWLITNYMHGYSCYVPWCHTIALHGQWLMRLGSRLSHDWVVRAGASRTPEIARARVVDDLGSGQGLLVRTRVMNRNDENGQNGWGPGGCGS